MVCQTVEQAVATRNRLCVKVTTIVRPMDGSWLHNNGPVFVPQGKTRLYGVLGGFNRACEMDNCDLGRSECPTQI